MADLVAEFPQFRGELAQALLVQRKGDIGSPRAAGSTNALRSSRSFGSSSNKRLAAAAPASNATFFERYR